MQSTESLPSLVDLHKINNLELFNHRESLPNVKTDDSLSDLITKKEDYD